MRKLWPRWTMSKRLQLRPTSEGVCPFPALSMYCCIVSPCGGLLYSRSDVVYTCATRHSTFGTEDDE